MSSVRAGRRPLFFCGVALLGIGCGRTSLDAWLDADSAAAGASSEGRSGSSGVVITGAGGRASNVSGAAGAAGTSFVAGQAGAGGSPGGGASGSAGSAGAGGARACTRSPADCYADSEPECRGQVPACTGAVLGHLVVSASTAVVLDIATSTDGRIAIGGYYQGTLDVDGQKLGKPTDGDDGFVLVFDATRKLLWSQFLGGQGAESVTGIDFTPEGDLVAQGTHDQHADASAQRPHGAGFLMRFAHDGKPLWTRDISKNDINPGHVGVDNDGAITAVGGFRYSFDYPGFPLEDASYSGYVLHLAADGTGLWAHSSKPAGWRTSGLQNVVVDDEDNIIVTGYGVEPGNQVPAYIEKVSATDDQLYYSYVLSASEYILPTALAVDRHMQVLLGGDFRGQLPLGSFALQSSQKFVNDPWLAKLGREGGVVWAHSAPGSSNLATWMWAVATDPERNIITGEGRDGFTIVRKLREDAAQVWSRSFQAQYGSGASLTTDNAGNIWVAGNFAKSMVVDDDVLVDPGSGSVFLLELSP